MLRNATKSQSVSHPFNGSGCEFTSTATAADQPQAGALVDRVELMPQGSVGDVRESEQIHLKQVLGRAHLRGVHSETAARLLTDSTLSQVLAAVKSLNKDIDEGIERGAEVVHPEKLLIEYLQGGSPFKGVPVITYVVLGGEIAEPHIEWRHRDDVEDSIPLGDSGIYCEGPGVVRALKAAVLPSGEFTSLKQMGKTLEIFRDTLPTGEIRDGCDARCVWMAAVLENVYGARVEKIKVRTRAGNFLEPSAPFPEGAKWVMHTAPIVYCESEPYVMDVSLPRPLGLEDWMARLNPGKTDTLVDRDAGWSAPLSFGYEGVKPETLERHVTDLRGFYLFENVDGNRPERQVRGAMSWVREERGMVPVREIDDKPAPKARLFVKYIKAGDGSITPKFAFIPIEMVSGFIEDRDTGIYFRWPEDKVSFREHLDAGMHVPD